MKLDHNNRPGLSLWDGTLTAIAAALEATVKLMVDRPQDAHVECRPCEGGATLLILVNPGDLGKIIGKQCRTARAFRILATAMGMAAEVRISVDIPE
jgi:hypothetical protein